MQQRIRQPQMPAEWSPHYGTWLSWPHNRDTWPGVLAEAEAAMAAAAGELSQREIVHINVLDEAHGRHVEQCLRGRADDRNIRLELIPTDDAWIRDYGAIFVAESGAECVSAAINFDYNAWGGKYPPFDQDRAVASLMAQRFGLECVDSAIVLEGGSVDVNGAGLGMVTEQCLLNPNRNPSLGRDAIAAVLAECLGLTELVWLGDGVVGDDTDGHIDNLARFVAANRVVTITTQDTHDPNFAALDDNRRKLEAFRTAAGAALEVIELPLPPPVMHNGVRLPASHANFYIANECVLMPAFGCDTDAIAAGILADCFPSRRIIPIDCRPLVVGLGALHCLTQQIPVMVSGSNPRA